MTEFDSGFDAVRRADRIVDALATGRRVPSNDPGDLAVASMLAHWRDDIRRQPVPELVTTRQAAAALRGVSHTPRSRFLPTVVGAVAAALLCLGGFGAVVYDAGPGDALYGLRTMLFGEAPVTLTRDERVVLAAQTQLTEVQQLIDQGQWQQAQDRLATASTTVGDVNDADRRQELVDQMNQLTVKVAARNPNATLPPGAPPPPPLPGMVVIPAPANELPSSETATRSTSATTTTTTTTTSSTPVEIPAQPAQPPPPPPPPPPGHSSSTTTTTTTTTSTSTKAAGADSAANVPPAQGPAANAPPAQGPAANAPPAQGPAVAGPPPAGPSDSTAPAEKQRGPREPSHSQQDVIPTTPQKGRGG